MKVSRDYSHKFQRGLYFDGSYTRTSFKDESNENWYPTYKAQTWKLTLHAEQQKLKIAWAGQHVHNLYNNDRLAHRDF